MDAPSEPAPFDAAAFRERFRGSEEEIRRRLRDYLRFFTGSQGPILDLGCGRGEFLDLAAGAGLHARGVEREAHALARCREKGHDVTAGDALEELARCPQRSLGGVIAIHVLEHWEFEAQRRFLALAADRLRPGGPLLIETPDPAHPAAFRDFWLDPTHLRPIPAELLRFLAEQAGFTTIEIHHPGEQAHLERAARRAGRRWWERLLGLPGRSPAPGDLTRSPVPNDPAPPDYALLARC